MPISQGDFAGKMTRALRKAGVTDELRYDADRFAIISEKHGEFFLSSAHQLYSEASFWTRGRVLKHFAQTMFSVPATSLPKSFDEARGNLVPAIRNAGYLDVAKLLSMTSPKRQSDDKKLEPRFDTLAGTLCVGLAYDSPNALSLFAPERLDAWGVTFEDAMKSARYNLSVRSRDPMVQISPGLFMAPWQDANAAGRLVLTELLTRLPVKGDVVASVPGRDFLFVAGSEDADALGAMIVAMEKAVAQNKPNTPELLRLRGTEWIPFALPPDHPQANRFHRLVKGFVAADYEEQKKLIEKIYQRDGVDRFVATYSAMERNDGEVSSWCSWAPCVSLLPRTDVIAIFDADAQQGDGRKPAMVSWDAAVEVVGHRMKRDPEYRLERYLVEESPTADEMVELRKRVSSF